MNQIVIWPTCSLRSDISVSRDRFRDLCFVSRDGSGYLGIRQTTTMPTIWVYKVHVLVTIFRYVLKCIMTYKFLNTLKLYPIVE